MYRRQGQERAHGVSWAGGHLLLPDLRTGHLHAWLLGFCTFFVCVLLIQLSSPPRKLKMGHLKSLDAEVRSASVTDRAEWGEETEGGGTNMKSQRGAQPFRVGAAASVARESCKDLFVICLSIFSLNVTRQYAVAYLARSEL